MYFTSPVSNSLAAAIAALSDSAPITRRGASVIGLGGFGTNVAGKSYQVRFVNLLHNQASLCFRIGIKIKGQGECNDDKKCRTKASAIHKTSCSEPQVWEHVTRNFRERVVELRPKSPLSWAHSRAIRRSGAMSNGSLLDIFWAHHLSCSSHEATCRYHQNRTELNGRKRVIIPRFLASEVLVVSATQKLFRFGGFRV